MYRMIKSLEARARGFKSHEAIRRVTTQTATRFKLITGFVIASATILAVTMLQSGDGISGRVSLRRKLAANKSCNNDGKTKCLDGIPRDSAGNLDVTFLGLIHSSSNKKTETKGQPCTCNTGAKTTNWCRCCHIYYCSACCNGNYDVVMKNKGGGKGKHKTCKSCYSKSENTYNARISAINKAAGLNQTAFSKYDKCKKKYNKMTEAISTEITTETKAITMRVSKLSSMATGVEDSIRSLQTRLAKVNKEIAAENENKHTIRERIHKKYKLDIKTLGADVDRTTKEYALTKEIGRAHV